MRALCAGALGATVLSFVPSASAFVCPRGTQAQNVYDPFTREHIATICVIPQQ